MKRLVYSNSSLARNVSAYVGVHVYDVITDELMMASIVGAEASVRGLIAAMQSGDRLTAEELFSDGKCISWPGTRRWQSFKTAKHGYRSVVRLVEDGAKDDQGIAHGLILHKSAYDPSEPAALMITMGKNGEAISEAEAFWRLWVSRWSVPGLPEWSAYVWSKARRYAHSLLVYKRPTQAITAYKVELTEETLAQIVTDGLKNGELTMPDGPETDGATLDEVEDVTTYLTTFSKPLARQISRRFKPLFIPGESTVNPLLTKLQRPLYPAQEDVVQGEALAMRRYKVGLIAADMGTGKTAMGAALPFLLHKGGSYRYVVMCPPHLVLKWEREVRAVVPGAKTCIVRNLGELIDLVGSSSWKPQAAEYVIISRETMKLGTTSRPAVMMGVRPQSPGSNVHKGETHFGPICPSCGTIQLDKEGAALDDPFHNQKDSNRKCKACGDVLWSVGLPGPYRGRALRRPERYREVEAVKAFRRWPLADYMKRHLKGWADGLIVDEVHELKAADSAQGNALGALASSVKYILALTGTLSGGYATDLFPILYRMRPALMKAEGFEFHALSRFAHEYGRVERITKTSDEDDESTAERNTYSKGKKSRSYVKVRPGISPRMYGKFLMPNTVFMELADLGKVLPPYTEEVELVPMEADLAVAYREFSGKLKARVKALLKKGSKRLLGAYLQALLNYPDKPFDAPPVVDKSTGETVATPTPLDKRYDRNKVARLVQIAVREKRAGRKVLVYATATNLRDIQPYLKEVLEANGLRVAVMYGKQVRPEARESWIAGLAAKGIDVLICNPKLVETGLDLLAFPTIVWFQTGYSTFTLRQASRRSWRLGQKAPVKVYFMAYQATLQESCLQLMGSKLAASMGLEGRWSDDGLQALCESEDMASALARALVSGLDGTDSAESIWRKMMPAEPEREGVEDPAVMTSVTTAADPKGEEDPIAGLVAVAAAAFFRRGRAKAPATVPPAREGEVAQLAFTF